MAKKKPRRRAVKVDPTVSATVRGNAVEVRLLVPLDRPAKQTKLPKPSPASDPMLPVSPNAERVTHSPDFASVNWYGTVYTFTPPQSLAVAALFRAREEGYLWLSTETLLQVAESSGSRVSDVFKNNPAWKRMIVPAIAESGTPGTYRLAEPPVVAV
jgi:hypothetical protein